MDIRNNSKSKIVTMAFVTLLLLLSLGVSSAQTVTSTPSNQPQVKSEPSPDTPAAVPSPTAAADENDKPLYGLQGVLIETLDGKTVAAQSIDQTFNPASVVKLATALVALQTFGPQYRFTTGIWVDGTLDRANHTLHGDLYISGRDPSFHDEHGVMLARDLNALGISRITGDLVVAPGFTMNFNWSARRSGERLFETIDSTRRQTDASSAWSYARDLQGNHAKPDADPSITVMGGVLVKPIPAGARLLLSHQSSKLADILKVLLCYSNNFMAERLGDSIGGPGAVQRSLTTSLGIPPEQLRLASLSGLGVNRVTPVAMMKIFRALREELRKHKLTTADIMPVAGIDPGTMEDRFADLQSRGSVIAKTGTLVRTDGGASSLVGQMKTANGETLLFVIFNQHGNVMKFRDNQDLLVKSVQNSRGGPKAFKYRPLALPMRLADTLSTVASDDEYEPATRRIHTP